MAALNPMATFQEVESLSKQCDHTSNVLLRRATTGVLDDLGVPESLIAESRFVFTRLRQLLDRFEPLARDLAALPHDRFWRGLPDTFADAMGQMLDALNSIATDAAALLDEGKSKSAVPASGGDACDGVVGGVGSAHVERVSVQLSAIQALTQQAEEEWSRAEHVLGEEAVARLWDVQFGGATAVTLERFADAYSAVMRSRYHMRVPRAARQALLHTMFSRPAEETLQSPVSRKMALKWLNMFGPLRESWTRMRSVCKATGHPHEWFVPFASRGQAVSKCRSLKWIVRYSSTVENALVLSFEDRARSYLATPDVQHVLIYNLGFQGYSDRRSKAHSYPTIRGVLREVLGIGFKVPDLDERERDIPSKAAIIPTGEAGWTEALPSMSSDASATVSTNASASSSSASPSAGASDAQDSAALVLPEGGDVLLQGPPRDHVRPDTDGFLAMRSDEDIRTEILTSKGTRAEFGGTCIDMAGMLGRKSEYYFYAPAMCADTDTGINDRRELKEREREARERHEQQRRRLEREKQRAKAKRHGDTDSLDLGAAEDLDPDELRGLDDDEDEDEDDMFEGHDAARSRLPHGADVVVTVKGEKFYLHSTVLSCRCPELLALIQSVGPAPPAPPSLSRAKSAPRKDSSSEEALPMLQRNSSNGESMVVGQLSLSEHAEYLFARVSARAFRQFVTAVYSGCVAAAPSSIVQVYWLAENLKCEDIKEVCRQTVYRKLIRSVPQFVLALEQARGLVIPEMYSTLVAALARQVRDLTSSDVEAMDELLVLKRGDLVALLQHQLLDLSELDAFRLAYRWGHAQLEAKGVSFTVERLREVLKDVLPHVRFALIPPQALYDVVEKTGVVSESLLLEAYRAGCLKDRAPQNVRNRPRQNSTVPAAMRDTMLAVHDPLKYARELNQKRASSALPDLITTRTNPASMVHLQRDLRRLFHAALLGPRRADPALAPDLAIRVVHDDDVHLAKPRMVLLYGHRAMLAARCSLFEKMLLGQFQEAREGNELRLPNVSRAAMRVVLEYVYGQFPLTLTPGVVGGVYAVADEFMMKPLKQDCLRFLPSLHQRQPRGLALVLSTAMPELRQACLKVMAKLAHRFLVSQLLFDLDEAALLELLEQQATNISLSEFELIKRLLDWCHVQLARKLRRGELLPSKEEDQATEMRRREAPRKLLDEDTLSAFAVQRIEYARRVWSEARKQLRPTKNDPDMTAFLSLDDIGAQLPLDDGEGAGGNGRGGKAAYTFPKRRAAESAAQFALRTGLEPDSVTLLNQLGVAAEPDLPVPSSHPDGSLYVVGLFAAFRPFVPLLQLRCLSHWEVVQLARYEVFTASELQLMMVHACSRPVEALPFGFQWPQIERAGVARGRTVKPPANLLEAYDSLEVIKTAREVMREASDGG